MALSWFWAADLQKLVVFYVFQVARATLCRLWAGRPSKTRVFLRFSSRPRNPLRTLGWSALENSWFFAIFNSLARPSAEFRVVESLPLWRGAHFLEAANLKLSPSQWDLLQSVLSASSKIVAEPLELLLKRFSFFENSFFLRFSIRPRDPPRSSGWSTFENSWFFLRFSNRSRNPLRSFAWSNRSRCGAALILMKLRDLNRCKASGVCTNAN